MVHILLHSYTSIKCYSYIMFSLIFTNGTVFCVLFYIAEWCYVTWYVPRADDSVRHRAKWTMQKTKIRCAEHGHCRRVNVDRTLRQNISHRDCRQLRSLVPYVPEASQRGSVLHNGRLNGDWGTSGRPAIGWRPPRSTGCKRRRRSCSI
jgi:hypothetical protein